MYALWRTDMSLHSSYKIVNSNYTVILERITLVLTIANLFSFFYSRGHADAEIEAVFAKYDLDGDRVLNAKEVRGMNEDLEGQKVMCRRFRPTVFQL